MRIRRLRLNERHSIHWLCLRSPPSLFRHRIAEGKARQVDRGFPRQDQRNNVPALPHPDIVLKIQWRRDAVDNPIGDGRLARVCPISPL